MGSLLPPIPNISRRGGRRKKGKEEQKEGRSSNPKKIFGIQHHFEAIPLLSDFGYFNKENLIASM
jgi:hypothetical protein